MDFFAAQGAARARTRTLLIAYAAAVACVVAAVSWVVITAWLVMTTDVYSPLPYGERIYQHLDVAFLTALLVFGIIAFAALYRIAQFRGGGGAVARALGGERVTRETQDPRRRRLLNVVEEIAIAAGVPVPEVYVLVQEAGINAFAAGWTTSDAAITVTRGTLENLNRAQLQGVIGHEFSHVLNGDMRLNTRLAGPLFGLLVIAIVARFVLRNIAGGKGRGAWAFALAALVIMTLGYVGVFFGRWLQAAICRQREFLADASSVQFTRDTTGLRDALVRIARSVAGSRIGSTESEDLAHLFIVPASGRLFATHPPLAARIRALDPHYDLRVLDKLDSEPHGGREDLELDGGDGATLMGVASAAAGRQTVDPGRVADTVGNPGVAQVRYAQALREALPAELEAALARGSTAACVWLALAMGNDEALRVPQLDRIGAALGPAYADGVAKFAPRVHALPLIQHLPLIQRALPALAALPADRRRALVALTRELAQADGRIDVLDFLLGTLASRYLADQLEPPPLAGRETLEGCARELATLFAVLAQAGHESPLEARRAYERGLATLLPRTRPEYSAPDAMGWPVALDLALARLAGLAPAAKEMLVEALVRTVEHDALVSIREAELLRAICAALRCPLPPLFQALAAAAPEL